MLRWVFCLCAAAVAVAQPTLILKNGRVWTGVPQRPFAESVAITGNSITAVGGREVAKLAGPKTRVIDLGGKFAMPGFNDSHVHFLGGARGLKEIDLTGACTIEEMQRRIRDYAERHPQLEWITGAGWEYNCFPADRMARKEDLDAAVKDRPAFIRAYDGHSGWANSRALRIGEVGRLTFNGFGEVERDALTGEPTGYLKEGAMSLVSRHVPRPTRETNLQALEEGYRLAASLGVTSLQNASGDADTIALYDEVRRRGKQTARVSFAISAGKKDAPLNDYAALKRQYADEMIRVVGIKLMLDGVIESHTAAMLDSYSDRPGVTGEPNWTAEDYNEMCVRADRLGLQIYTHAIGDRAVRMALDGFDQAVKRNGLRFHQTHKDRRFRIEHIETIHPADIPRFAELGVLAMMQPIHADPGTIDVWSKAVGPKRLTHAFAWRTLERAGARVTFGSDWPACISFDPIRGLHNAVNRRTIDGKPENGWIPTERVSVEMALRAYTSSGAVASFEEARKGRLAPGMLADVVVLSQDPFKIDPIRIHETRVLTTVFDGRVVYQRP
ncbi:MAG: amidohydrolase [Bryobacteraceae bacterium]|nr:amidohydrolase [Bryobacteraceae bacterium]